MTAETTPRQDLLAKLETFRASLPGLKAAVAETTKAIQQDHTKTPPEQVIALTAAASKAQTAHDGAVNDIAKVERGIKALDAQAKREAVVGVIAPFVSAISRGFVWDKFPCDLTLTGGIPVEALPDEARIECEKAEVKVLNIRVDTGERLVDVKPSGATPKPPRTGKGNGRGGRKRMTPRGEMNLSEVFKEYAAEAGVSDERIAAVLADPSNQGISHRGKAVADKLGFAEVESA